jgi:1-acyl-sn-glycerol-3-phosphate acyltransferase
LIPKKKEMNPVVRVVGALYALYGLLLFVATTFIVVIPIWLVSLADEPRRARMLHPIFRIWMAVYMPLVLCPVRRRGKEHFRKGENYVVVVNHNSLMDIPVSSPWIPGANKTLGKIEMSRVPVFGIIYKASALIVDRKREESRRMAFTLMQQALDQGVNLCLYPEGTRNKTDQPMQPFFDGAFVTAIKTQKPIIPGVIFNTKKILSPTVKFWGWPSRIHFHFLEPIPTKGLSLEDVAALKAKVHGIMTAYYVEHQNELA